MELVEKYISHRLQREQQILSALRASTTPLTLEQLVSVIYKDLGSDPMLQYAAANSIHQHLLKLAEEGQAALFPGSHEWTARI